MVIKKKKKGKDEEEPEDPLGGKIAKIEPGEQVHQ